MFSIYESLGFSPYGAETVCVCGGGEYSNTDSQESVTKIAMIFKV